MSYLKFNFFLANDYCCRTSNKPKLIPMIETIDLDYILTDFFLSFGGSGETTFQIQKI